MASAMFLKDGTTLRSSAIRELSFEKHADTPERAEAPSRSLELHVTNPRRKDDCGGQPAIEAQTLLPRDLVLALQGALRPSAAHVLRLRRVQLLAGSWVNVACGWKWRASWQSQRGRQQYLNDGARSTRSLLTRTAANVPILSPSSCFLDML